MHTYPLILTNTGSGDNINYYSNNIIIISTTTTTTTTTTSTNEIFIIFILTHSYYRRIYVGSADQVTDPI